MVVTAVTTYDIAVAVEVENDADDEDAYEDSDDDDGDDDDDDGGDGSGDAVVRPRLSSALRLCYSPNVSFLLASACPSRLQQYGSRPELANAQLAALKNLGKHTRQLVTREAHKDIRQT